MKTLDQYDIAMIRHFKANTPLDLNLLCRIWAERCNVDVSHTHLVWIAAHLAKLVETFNPISASDLIERLNPASTWRYGIGPDASYNARVIAVMASHLALTEVVKLPGYTS